MQQATPNTASEEVKKYHNTSYVRTEEDIEQDKAERAWKQQRNEQARRDFMRRYPSGRSN